MTAAEHAQIEDWKSVGSSLIEARRVQVHFITWKSRLQHHPWIAASSRRARHNKRRGTHYLARALDGCSKRLSRHESCGSSAIHTLSVALRTPLMKTARECLMATTRGCRMWSSRRDPIPFAMGGLRWCFKVADATRRGVGKRKSNDRPIVTENQRQPRHNRATAPIRCRSPSRRAQQ
jgi:hypothetical protein